MSARTARSPWLVAGLATILYYPTFGSAQEPLAQQSLPPASLTQASLTQAPLTQGLPTEGPLPVNECESCECQRRWSFRVIPYGWIPGFDGDLTVRSATVPVDASIGKVADIIWNDFNAAALGQIEASNGRVGVIFNGVYVDVSPGGEVDNLDFSSRLRLSIFDLSLTCQADCVPEVLRLPCGSRFEFLGGVRYVCLSAGLTATEPGGDSASAEGSQDWFDAIVGCRLRVPLCPCVTAQVRGDIGGFDIGEASRFTWNVEATLEYRCSERCSLVAGWRWLDIDYATSSGNPRFGFDMNLSGPLVGFALDF